MLIQRFVRVLMVLLLVAAASAASAQTFTGDARKVGMGGVGGNSNIAASMVDPAQSYTAIPLPFGLFQVLGNLKEFNPDDTKFDPVRAIEGASSPIHYGFGRSSNSTEDPQQRFVRDLVNGEVNRDLSTYRTFRLPESLSAQALASGVGGKTIKFAKQDNGAFHGIYIGAGPYLSYSTTLGVDPKLTEILGSETAITYPNSSFQIQNGSALQLAMSIVFGYRGRLAFGESERDGVYVAGNYRYLKGFKYLQPDMAIRFDTDATGKVLLNPSTVPVNIDDLEGSSGKGRAIDLGVEVVRGKWEAGAGVNGIANQIEWTDLTLKRLTLTSLTAGAEFINQTLPAPVTSVTVELPKVTSANLGFDAGGWAVTTNVMKGYNGGSFHGGVERRLGLFALRGGGRYTRGRWDPTYGFGVGRKVALDVGFFGNHGNLQDKRQTAMAISIRINHDSK